jgi:TonB-linked SusC/RagA family outer membrane protein
MKKINIISITAEIKNLITGYSKRFNNLLRFIFFNFLIVAFAASGLAQNITVSGIVTGGDNNEPLIGATVVITGTTTGTVTDLDGRYSIEVPDEPGVKLSFSFVGYVSEETALEGRSEIDMVLIPSLESLEEVVVVGYGVQKKSLVTGSIAKVEAEQVSQTQNLRVEQALQGKTSGVTVAQTSGQPGAQYTVRIRGTGTHQNAEPLYIIDGMRVSGGFDYLDPNDIESIEILKDAASAAIYGAEAANGVILITTKKGQVGKSRISYDFYYGIQSPVKTVDMMNAKQYVDYYREAYTTEILRDNDTATMDNIKILVDSQFPYSSDTIGGGTDWMGQIFNNAPMQKHYLTFSGGSEKSSYFISTGYYTQDGIVGADRSSFKRYTARINSDLKVNDWIKVGNTFSYTHKVRKDIDENNEFGSVISSAFNLDPIMPVYMDSTDLLADEIANYDRLPRDEDGRIYGLSRLVQNEFKNPLSTIAVENQIYNEDKLVGGVYTELSPIKGLVYTSKFNVDLAFGQTNSWNSRWWAHNNQQATRSRTETENNRWFTYQWDNYASYSLSAGNHNVSLLAGMSFREYVRIRHGAIGEGLAIPGDGYTDEGWDYARLDLVIGEPDFYNPYGLKEHNVLLSYFGRLDYNYKEKYLITSNLRYDGSNKFGENNKFGLFPSVSGGWIISREEFWNIPFVSFFKARASWGQNGSTSNLGDFDYVSTMDGRPTLANGVGEIIKGAAPSRVSNPDLKWETSEQIDAGFDLGFLENRLTLTADYYEKNTKDLLAQATTPFLIGADPPMVNAANITNYGYEFELGFRESKGEFKYSIMANASHLKNEVTELDTSYIVEFSGTSVGPSTGNITRFDEGYPVWYFYGYQATGIFQNEAEILAHANDTGRVYQPRAVPGDVIFEDTNGDGVLNEDDRVYIGKPHPDWVFGLNMNFEYKNFDLSLFIQGVYGIDLFNGIVRTDIAANNRPLYYYDDRWTGEGSTNDWFRPTNLDRNLNFRPSSLFIEDGSYVRLKQCMLGYTVPKSLTTRVSIENLRLYVSANNLITLTKYNGIDPEIGNTNDESDGEGYVRSIGVDRGFYPVARQIIFGVNVSF